MPGENALRALAAALLLGVASPAGAQSLSSMVEASRQAEAGNTLLGSIEFKSTSLKGLPQWTRVLGAMRSVGPAFQACAADAGACSTAVLQRWRTIVVAARELPQVQRAKAVNQYFNTWPYKTDTEVWGVREYWATPKEFISRSGDCEDYSIAKYYALRHVGYDVDQVRIVALRDTIRGYGHAVLAVYVDGDILILDNLSQFVASHRRYKHYQPQVSMNEVARWAHVGGFAPDTAPADDAGLSANTLFRRR